MQPHTKIKNVLRGLTKRWGLPGMKRTLWDREYASGKWVHCEHTRGDRVYGFVERYCRNGSILDLGCGSGNTGNELAVDRYQTYTGVDVSEVAAQKAAQRSEANGRGGTNRYEQGDMLSYVPSRKHDVILFRESLHNIPELRMKSALDRYSQYLTANGVFVVTLSRDSTRRFREIVGWIETNYRVVEKYSAETADALVVIFR